MARSFCQELKNRADGAPKLLVNILRKTFFRPLFNELLVFFNQFLQIFRREIGIVSHFALLFEFLQNCVERLMVGIVPRLDAHDDIAIHLDKTPVAIVGKPRIAGFFGQSGDSFIVQAEVEDGVHHARHGIARPRADGKKERILGIAEFFAHLLFDRDDRLAHAGIQAIRVSLFIFVKIGADIGGDSKTGGHRQTDAGHFGQVGALSAEERFHAAVSVHFIAKGVNIFFPPHVFLIAGIAASFAGWFFGAYFIGHTVGFDMTGETTPHGSVEMYFTFSE